MGCRARLGLAAGLILLAGACGTDPDGPRLRSDSAELDAAKENVPSALKDPTNPAFPSPLIKLDHLVSGGPPPDGIPPIDNPKFQAARDVDWLEDAEPVLSLSVEGETRAYPLQIMTWHEIVNDTVGSVPVTVTYCPLCNSGVAFHRRVEDRLLDFGTSGMLYADNLVMYDRQTESLWPQLTGAGLRRGTHRRSTHRDPDRRGRLEPVPDRPPQRTRAHRDTGYRRDYGRNPYAGYDDPDGRLLVEPPDGRDPRLPVKERVIGIRVADEAVAILRQAVADAGVMLVRLARQTIVLWHRPGQRSALDDDTVAAGRDIGTVSAFDPHIDGRPLTFAPQGTGFRDFQTGSTWNVLGEATAGPLKGRRLRPVTHLDTFWFAWVAFQPETRLHS